MGWNFFISFFYNSLTLTKVKTTYNLKKIAKKGNYNHIYRLFGRCEHIYRHDRCVILSVSHVFVGSRWHGSLAWGAWKYGTVRQCTGTPSHSEGVRRRTCRLRAERCRERRRRQNVSLPPRRFGRGSCQCNRSSPRQSDGSTALPQVKNIRCDLGLSVRGKSVWINGNGKSIVLPVVINWSRTRLFLMLMLPTNNYVFLVPERETLPISISDIRNDLTVIWLLTS